MRRMTMAVALVLGLAAPACAQVSPQAPPVPAEWQVALAAIDERMLAFQEEENIPGMVWGVVKDGRLLHFTANGVQSIETGEPVTANSLFRIASMSKAFTALAILKLRDEGKLQLDALAETYVPELKALKYPTTDSPRIRVRDLLSHVGGFVTDDPWGDRQQVMSETEFTRLLNDGVQFTRPPQTRFEYSNLGYALLGRIVTNVSGKPYDQYIMGEIMRPLGMNDTRYEVRDAPAAQTAVGYRWENGAWSPEPVMQHGVFGAMGGVQTSASDYVKWMAFLLDAWPARDGAETGPVKRSTVRELAQGVNFPMIVQRPGLEEGQTCSYANTYAMGMNASQDCDLGFTLGHSGGYPGYGSNLLLLPNQGVGLFVFASRTYAGPSMVNRMAALELNKVGMFKPVGWPVSPALTDAHKAAGAMYAAGSVEPGRSLLAMNFLMDRSAENWAAEFARLKELAGECKPEAPVTLGATGEQAGYFTWTCEKGEMDGNILLAPTRTTGIQSLRFGFVPPPETPAP
jgi:D-alanyl-D-alanine-carboxypeptidase/D-alanyl-D-alanine-endopeptidase